MGVVASTALIPTERSTALALRTPGDSRNGVPAHRSKTGQEFVFLGYGPSSGGELYDGGGKPVQCRSNPGSVVDLYA